MQAQITTVTPGKLILLGEYAVLEGAPALVAAVNRFARVSLTPLTGEKFRISAPMLGIDAVSFHLDRNTKVCFCENMSTETSSKLVFFSTAMEVAARYSQSKNVKLTPAEINLDTGDFFLEKSGAKLGLGSSAALTVSLLGALLIHAGEKIAGEDDYFKLFDLALDAHRAAQRNIGSGIDLAASIFGGVLQYQINRHSIVKKAKIKHFHLPNELRLLTVWTGKSASTSEFVKDVNAFRDKNPREFNDIIRRMADISLQGCEALKNGRTDSFLEIVPQYYQQMEKLGRTCNIPIISPEHRRIAEIVQSGGAVYKPSGAGGGDLGIAFAMSEGVLANCGTELRNAGFKVTGIKIFSNGIQIKSNGVN